MTAQDRQEMEDATESAILDPHRPTACFLKTFYDHSVAHATQAANQRCVLAALIRTATLPKDTQLTHLIDEQNLNQWDAAVGNRLAASLAKKSQMDRTTQALVAAMDWSHAAAEDLIERWRAQEIVRQVLDASPALGFPSPPDRVVAYLVEHDLHLDAADVGTGEWKPLDKAAPPGRLLSLLFVHMARVRSPSSMVMVWVVFCQELRRRWDARESLPNMNYVPALDPPPHGTTRRCFSSGGRGSLAAQIHSSEPDPDDNHCLIGQKLQVFNLGLESVVTEEVRKGVQRLEQKERLDSNDDKDDEMDDGDDDDDDLTEDEGDDQVLKSPSRTLLNASFVMTPTAAQTLLNGSFVDGLTRLDVDDDRMNVDSPEGSSRSDNMSEFYDADEASSVAFRDDERRGARCPVQGVMLVSTGDQLYAPYLQRPYPLTDDVIMERRLVLSRQNTGKRSTIVQQRLEIAQRFQRPKLHSDMRSFKAANPGATFEDFVGWYGNPSDPLEDVYDSEVLEHVGDPNDSTKAEKLDKAAEAIFALEQTRNFWTKTWDEADPLPAAEQESLFDADSTVEMALDYLENIHPTTLLCQVMAVNLSTAYFILSASAGACIRIRSVAATLGRLRETVDTALQLLAKEATGSTGPPDAMASVETLTACGKACEAIASAEVIVSRAASLLHKLPQQYKLVEAITKLSEGAPLSLADDEAGRSTFLETVHEQQRQLPSAGVNLNLAPALREYLLQNTDDSTPCQLCVRYNDDGINVCDGAGRGGTIFALTKTTRG